MGKNAKPRLNITIGVDYKSAGEVDAFKLGGEIRTKRDAVDIDGNVVNSTVFASTGIPISNQPVFKEVLTVGSGSLALQTLPDPNMEQTEYADCDNPNYRAVLDSGNGYMFLQNLEYPAGNVIHWGVKASGVSSVIDKITYPNFALVGMLNPGEKSMFRVSPGGPAIKFVSASGSAAIAATGSIKESQPSRFTYTIFPR
jgi:hypothetical protein